MYEKLLGTFSLDELFPLLTNIAHNFEPHPDRSRVEKVANAKSRELGIWLPGVSEHSASMNALLHNNCIDPVVLVILGVYYNLLFKGDDVGTSNANYSVTGNDRAAIREFFDGFKQIIEQLMAASLTQPPASAVDMITDPSRYEEIRRFAKLFREVLEKVIGLAVPDHPVHAVKYVVDELEIRIQHHGLANGEDWLAGFIFAACAHLQQAGGKQNSYEYSGGLTEEEYEHSRINDSGMLTSVWAGMLAKLSLLDWGSLDPQMRNELIGQVKRCILIAAYVNDFYSLDKETRGSMSDYNLLLVIMRQRKLTLKEAVLVAAEIVNLMLQEFMTTQQQLIRSEHLNLGIRSFLDSLYVALQATKVWQQDYTTRYQSPTSIFVELLVPASPT